MLVRFRPAVLFTCAVSLLAQDPGCPRYPEAMRTEMMATIELDRAFGDFAAKAAKARGVGRKAETVEKSSFVDQRIFTKLLNDNVAPAPATSDEEFLRRVYIDLTGRIPSPEDAAAFLADSDSAKRTKLVDKLLASSAFTDQLTTFWANKFKVTRAHESIGTLGRNTFYEWLRKSMADDRSWDDFARELIGAAGEVDTVPGTQFFARWMDINGPIQDSWDNTTDKITTTFLGFKTECISCHNGRAHLEKINLYLTKRTRKQFWEMSAFFSRMNFLRWSDDNIGFRPRMIVIDRPYGSYTGAVNPANPGCRPPRVDAVTDPTFILTGAKPSTGNWRQEYANMITSDRQFARATVNHIWALLFGTGIVDPPEAWDFVRTDPANPPPGDWPLQISHPELLEDLADFFIQNNFKFRPLFRLLLNSETYQLSSRYNGEWQPAYVRYFARHNPQRLTAEQLFDSLTTATRTEQPMQIAGINRVLTYANQLPDATEPATDGNIVTFLNNLGRGDWLTVDRSNSPSILGLLYVMNDGQNVNRTLGNAAANVSSRSRILQIDADAKTDDDAIQRMFIATLSRYPSDAELLAARKYKVGARAQWLSDLQWALVNKLDFIFNR